MKLPLIEIINLIVRITIQSLLSTECISANRRVEVIGSRDLEHIPQTLLKTGTKKGERCREIGRETRESFINSCLCVKNAELPMREPAFSGASKDICFQK